MASVHIAAPLYKERSEVVLGKKDVPIEYAQRSQEEGQVPKAEPEAPAEDQGAVPAGIPEFWLGAMRAHPLISEHVRPLPGTALPQLVAPVMDHTAARPLLRSMQRTSTAEAVWQAFVEAWRECQTRTHAHLQTCKASSLAPQT